MASGNTFVCMKDETKGGYTALCKNSNRNPNETHEVVIIPEIKIDDSTVIECTYSTVSPPKSHSHRCLLSKPVWMWGAEMGSSSAGVCIATENVYPNSYGSSQRTPHGQYLTGMDLLRLALMFGDSALDAVKIIDHYLKHYQQNGSMEWMNNTQTPHYSTFLVADYNELWIVETINQMFVAKKYCHGIHAISNRYMLSSPFDMISTTLTEYCDQHNINWTRHLDIAYQFGEWKRTYFDDSSKRQQYVQKRLDAISKHRKLNVTDFTKILRSHSVRYSDENGIDKGLLGMDICCHGSYGSLRTVNTNGSLICILRRDGTVLNLVTGTSAPCISMFKPIYIGCTVPKELGVPFRKFRNGNFVDLGGGMRQQTFDGVLKKKTDIVSTASMLVYNHESKSNRKQLWWTHETFHRLYLKYFIHNKEFNTCVKTKIKEFEQNMFDELVDEYHEYHGVHATERQVASDQQLAVNKYWKESYDILEQMLKQIDSEIELGNVNKIGNAHGFAAMFNIFHCYALLTRYLYHSQWSYWNKLAGIYISKNGTLSDKSASPSATTSNTVLSMFRGNGFFRWAKLMLASLWSVLLIAIGWKMLN
eukprot:18965_1